MHRTIAIAGLGRAARTIHLPAYTKLKNLKTVGGFDPAVGDGDFPFPLFNSLEEMLDQTRPDILAIASPPNHHFEQARVGLQSGCHVFCEKPMVDTLAQADELVKLSAEMNRWLVVNSEFRFMEIHRASKQLIGSADFGDLLFLSAHQTFRVTESTEAGWRGLDNRRTCKDFGIHVLDLCRYFFNENPTSIYARMPRGDDPSGPDHLNLIQLEFSGDRVAHITLDRLSRGRHRYLDMRLDGSRAAIETRIGGNIAVSTGIRGGTRRPFLDVDISPGGGAWLFRGERQQKITSDPWDLFPNATGNLLSAFLRALDDGTPPPCNAADNRCTLALMLSAYESHDRAAPVAMTL